MFFVSRAARLSFRSKFFFGAVCIALMACDTKRTSEPALAPRPIPLDASEIVFLPAPADRPPVSGQPSSQRLLQSEAPEEPAGQESVEQQAWQRILEEIDQRFYPTPLEVNEKITIALSLLAQARAEQSVWEEVKETKTSRPFNQADWENRAAAEIRVIRSRMKDIIDSLIELSFREGDDLEFQIKIFEEVLSVVQMPPANSDSAPDNRRLGFRLSNIRIPDAAEQLAKDVLDQLYFQLEFGDRPRLSFGELSSLPPLNRRLELSPEIFSPVGSGWNRSPIVEFGSRAYRRGGAFYMMYGDESNRLFHRAADHQYYFLPGLVLGDFTINQTNGSDGVYTHELRIDVKPLAVEARQLFETALESSNTEVVEDEIRKLLEAEWLDVSIKGVWLRRPEDPFELNLGFDDDEQQIQHFLGEGSLRAVAAGVEPTHVENSESQQSFIFRLESQEPYADHREFRDLTNPRVLVLYDFSPKSWKRKPHKSFSIVRELPLNRLQD